MRLIFILLVEWVSIVYASTEDSQFWLSNVAQIRLNSEWSTYVELQPRYGDNMTRLDRVLLRPAVVYHATANRSFFAGYLYMPMQALGLIERRYWLQYMEHWMWGEGKIIGRQRMELRDLPMGSGAAYRLRSLFKLTYPLITTSSWSAVVWDEVFWSINSVKNGPVSGLDQNRFFIGIEKRWTSEFATEMGYLHNFVNSHTDHVNHVFLLMLTYIR